MTTTNLTADGSRRLRVTRGDGHVLVDDPGGLRLDGCAPGAVVEVAASVEVMGATLDARASFIADASGTVDTARDPSRGGTYQGVDPFGLFWSGTPRGAAAFVPGTPIVVRLDIRAGADVLQRTLQRYWTAADTIVESVNEPGVVGLFARPGTLGPHPGVIAFGGSGGGLGPASMWAPLLAAHGFAALSIAYFGLPGLPSDLARIDVDVVGRAAAWMDQRHEVSATPLAVMGMSRGSELAMLAGIHVDRIGTVVALAPSGISWPALGVQGPIDAPSWTVDGVDVPYPWPAGGPLEPSTDGPIALRPWFERALLDRSAIHRAEIAVERIGGPLLLVSGEADLMWPSATFGDLVIERLERAGADVDYTHLHYPDAGHALAGPPGMPIPTEVPAHPLTGERYALGGTNPGNALARADSWPRILAFLARASTSVTSGAARS